jgi:mxaJ protein
MQPIFVLTIVVGHWALAAWGLAAPMSASAAAPKAPLRVCADPNNLPFSNQQGEGFENTLAEWLAAKLNRELSYS